jgi:hypothetical protein
MIHLFWNQLEIQAGHHTTIEIVFYNFNLSSLLAMDCLLEVVTRLLKKPRQIIFIIVSYIL